MSNEILVNTDSPLQPGNALSGDKLDRQDFALRVIGVLRNVSKSSGLIVSIEGEWGSGKTSTLGIVEDLLIKESEDQAPIVVHFNPWLVGDREALVRQFLASIASAIKLTDHSKNAKAVAKQLKTYSKAFDVVKLIPGAEPWASIVKSVISSMGEATDKIADYKTPDLEQQKTKVEDALKKYPRPIVVFIDDIDRLFPAEVYEMIRIIKAVGDLPNIGYVVAWDASYVSSALEAANVPQPNTYLDKIVQVRMPLPGMTLAAKESLIDAELESLPSEALKDHFPGSENRLSMLYFSGLRDVLEQPRDITRVFNTVRIIEPPLRGELAFSDIVGFSTLIVKAPDIFNLLRKNPRGFVGSLPGDINFKKDKEIIESSHKARSKAYTKASMPSAVKGIVNFLFPLLAKDDETLSLGGASEIEGHIASPSRLLVALQAYVSPSEISLVKARRYLVHPGQRDEIEQSLTSKNCKEFLQRLGDVAQSSEGLGISDLEQLCISISRLVEKPPFPQKSLNPDLFSIASENIAERSIKFILTTVDPKQEESICAKIICDEKSLTVATQLLEVNFRCHNNDLNEEIHLFTDKTRETELLEKYASNILDAAKNGSVLDTCNPGYILSRLPFLAKPICPELLKTLAKLEPNLDKFAATLFSGSKDSHKGQIYALPKNPDIVEAYCDIETLKEHAVRRMDDESLPTHVRAAWQAVIDGKSYYGIDCTEAD